MDSFFVRMEDPKEIKVGVPTVFWGECGLGIAGITLMVDGFEIGKAIFIETADFLKLGYRTWKLTYTFKGAGKARALQILAADSKGSASFVCLRKQDLKVEAANEEVKSEKPVGKFPVKIIESNIQHIPRWNMNLQGLIVHFTASNAAAKPYDVISGGNDSDPELTYWVMDYNGDVYKTHELDEGGYHCASSEHRWSLGIEVMSPGKLSERNGKLYYWYDARRENPPEYPRDKARYFKQQPTQFLNGRTIGPQTGGWYVPFTEAQERALVGLVQYLKDNCPKFSIDRVLGHDEVLADYRDDPGGSLSMSMKDFREYLKKVIV